MRAAVQSTVLAVVGVHGFHGFLRLYQPVQLLLQLGDGLRVVLPDAAHAGAADFIKQPLDMKNRFLSFRPVWVRTSPCWRLFSF